MNSFKNNDPTNLSSEGLILKAKLKLNCMPEIYLYIKLTFVYSSRVAMFLSFTICVETCCKTSARSACSCPRSGRCPLPLLRACLCPADGSYALCSHSHKEASGLTVNLQQMDEQRSTNQTQEEQLRVFIFSS